MIMAMYATMNPPSGETIIGMTTLSRIEVQWTIRPQARPAPASPPMSACEEDDGRPNHQVMRFQAIAENSAAKTTMRAIMLPSSVP